MAESIGGQRACARLRQEQTNPEDTGDVRRPPLTISKMILNEVVIVMSNLEAFHRADLASRDAFGNTAFGVAHQQGNAEIVALIEGEV